MTAHIIDNELASGEKRYGEVPKSALDDVEPLGVSIVILTQAPQPGQTMVMIEYDTKTLGFDAGNRVSSVAKESIAILQHHDVAPGGEPTEIAKEFGESLKQQFLAEGE